jgi:biotin carboxyl carrier protein
MQKTFRITVEGRSYNVLVEDITDPALAPPPAVVAAPVAPASAPAAPPPAAPAPATAAPVAAGAGAEVAPLAGVVQAIEVRVGQPVNPGDRIATIEAMKMKTFVTAKGAGTVASIAVKVNDSVETGQVLLVLG